MPGPRGFAAGASEAEVPPGGGEPGGRRRLVLILGLLGVLVLAGLATLFLLTRSNKSVAGKTPGSSPATTTTGGGPTETPVGGSTPPAAATSAPATAVASGAPATPPAPPSQSNSPLATARALFPEKGPACGSQAGTYSQACPVSAHLGARLTELYGQQAPFEPLCRCNPQTWTAVAFQASTAGTNQVKITFTFGSRQASMIVAMVQGASGWVADDTICTATSIYDKQPLACFQGG